MASEMDTRGEMDLSTYCTIKREPRRNRRPPAILESPNRSAAVLTKRYSGSSDDLYVGTRVSIVPEPEAYAIQVTKSGNPTEIDLDLGVGGRGGMDQLAVEKPTLSNKAWKRFSGKHKGRIKTESGGSEMLEALRLEATPLPLMGGDRLRVSKSASPGPRETQSSPRRTRKGLANGLATVTKVAIPVITRTEVEDMDNVQRPPSKSLSTRDSSSSPPESTDNFLREPTNGTSTRRSVRSIDSGLGDLDPGHSGRDSLVSEGDVLFHSQSLTSSPIDRQPMASSLSQQQLHVGRKMVNLKDGFSSLRAGPKQRRGNHRQLLANRKSMLLSELCVVTVSIPGDVAQGQKGRGTSLKFRFSPYTLIEFLRVAILKQFHERCDLPIPQLSKLHLFRYMEDEEGWEWLEEDQTLNHYKLPTECKLELKTLEPAYRDVRVVIPSLEASMSVEYDQFSTVGDVLCQVLSLSDPPMDASEGYSLYHVRLRMHLDSSDSMIYYHILPTDVLECRLSVGRLHSVILTVKIPVIQSSRKVKVSLDETVGELISTLKRRIPDPDSSRWVHMALYLQSRESDVHGLWMEDYKFLAAYKLKATDVLEFRPKYRPMVFEFRVFPHDHFGNEDKTYGTLELLVAQDTLVSEVVDLLCHQRSLEYDPRYYGLYFHDDTELPLDSQMWTYLDSHYQGGYQDSLVLHMVHKPIKVSFDSAEDSRTTVQVDFSKPGRVLRDYLARRYGLRHSSHYGLQYAGIELDLSVSLHNQGILEQEHVSLVYRGEEAASPIRRGGKRVFNQREEIDRRDSLIPAIQDDTNVWDEGPDSEKNLRYNVSKPGTVAGATFNKLVERVTSEKDHDIEFVKTFLYTYQSFATPDRLLRKLLERYNVVRPEGMSPQGFAVMKQTIQARVINALKLWVELSVDFKDNVPLQDALLQFVSTVLILDHPRLCKPLRTNIMVIKGVIQKKNLKMFRDPPPPVKFPSANSTGLLTIFDFDPEEVARQMTIIDFTLFAKIKPCELLNQAWQKAKYKHRAANILRLVDRINNLTLWVATTILSQRDVHERAKRISDFVQISSHLQGMHNLCTLMSLLNGLAHPSISRLKRSFSKLDKATTKRLEVLQTLARPENNFKLLRDELKRSSNPCIPYLGLYMSDLTFVDNGNVNFHDDGLINFSKCRLIYNQIRDLVLRQDRPYNFEEVPALHENLTRFHFLDTDVLYDVSLQREPRDKGK
ncbi:uncharacterized protein LOC135332919 isoform X2 [Halichondria panicea]|uniref:uncharacterized protein LOC135332919 isoform X2 n=1 Tax=Halichondria panicea TaxID=6063 RepID=UPI00312B95D2